MTALTHQGSRRADLAKRWLAFVAFVYFAIALFGAGANHDIPSLVLCAIGLRLVPELALRIPDAWLVAPERPRVDRKAPSRIGLTSTFDETLSQMSPEVLDSIAAHNLIVDSAWASRSPRSSGREE